MYFHVSIYRSLYHQVSVYNVFVERGNVAVLQCGVPASVRDSVEVRKIPEKIAIRRLERSECDFRYAEAGGGRVNVLSVCRSRIFVLIFVLQNILPGQVLGWWREDQQGRVELHSGGR